MWIIVLKHWKYQLFRSVIHRHNDESDKCHEWRNNTISAILNAMESRQAVKWFVSRIIELDEQLSDIENQLNQRYMEILYAKNILAISGIGENILSVILAEIGDISRFDNVKEIQKLNGLGLVACSSGKHTGETKISPRGRK